MCRYNFLVLFPVSASHCSKADVVSRCFLGIDIGGSSIKAGVVTEEGRVLAEQQIPSVLNDDLEAGLSKICSTARELIDESGASAEGMQAVGLAAPGTMDVDQGIVFHPFNLPGWENVPLAKLISERLKLPSYLQNDANAAAYGEQWMGRAQGASSVVLWTLGTGVGSGIVINGKIWTGAHSHAGECGHMILQMDEGPPSEFGIDGTPELYFGAKALVQRCCAAIEAGADSILSEPCHGSESLTPLDIADAAEKGDRVALECILESARCLGVATVSIMHILNPEIILIGGAMTFGRDETELGRAFLDRVRQEVRQRAFPIPAERTVIDYAALGGNAGFIGAAGYALSCVDGE